MAPDELDYELPPGRIAQTPAERRDEARLLVCSPTSERLEHRTFRELPALLPPRSLLVLNDSKVVRARLLVGKPSGARAELLILDAAFPDDKGCHGALLRGAKRLRPGARLAVLRRDGAPAGVELEVVGRDGDAVRLRIPGGTAALLALLEAHGQVPLPPYVERAEGPLPLDEERYQTVFARHPGAVAAPTAGLHFTEALLTRLTEAGHDIVPVTLHVSAATFLPLRPDRAPMHAESYEVSRATASAVLRAKEEHRPVIAVGTTAVRALESAADRPGLVVPPGSTTRLFIEPGYRFRIVDGLITNFHLPGTTLLRLVAALIGPARLKRVYAEALAQGYRFYSYGDAMVALPEPA